MQSLDREIDARLAAMRPWYAAFTRGDVFLISAALLFGLTVLLAVIVAFGPNRPPQPPSPDPRDSLRVIILFLTGTAGFMGLAWVLHKARNWLFPIGTFALGSGKGRYDVHEKVRWTVAVGFAVSVVASVVAALRW